MFGALIEYLHGVHQLPRFSLIMNACYKGEDDKVRSVLHLVIWVEKRYFMFYLYIIYKELQYNDKARYGARGNHYKYYRKFWNFDNVNLFFFQICIMKKGEFQILVPSA